MNWLRFNIEQIAVLLLCCVTEISWLLTTRFTANDSQYNAND